MPTVPTLPSLLLQPPTTRRASLSAKPAIVEPKLSPKADLNGSSLRERPTAFAESLREADRTLDQKPADKSQHDASSTRRSAIDEVADRSDAEATKPKSGIEEPTHEGEDVANDSAIATVDPKPAHSDTVANPVESIADVPSDSTATSTNAPTAANGAFPATDVMANLETQASSPIEVQSESSVPAAHPHSTVTPSVASVATENGITVAAPAEPAMSVAAAALTSNLDVDAGSHAPTNKVSAEAAATPSSARPSFTVPRANNAQPDQRTPESGVLNQTAAASSNLNAAPAPLATDVTTTQQPTRQRGRNDQAPSDRPITPIDSGLSSTPATARVLQVEAGVRLENATGQAASWNTQATMAGSQGNQAATIALQPHHAASSGTQIATPSGAPESDQNTDAPLAHRIVRGLSTMVNQRGGVMSMRLDPPELGALRVQMTLNQGVVTAEFQASSTQAHTMLERSMNTLRSALEGQGLTVDRLVAHAPASGSASFSRDDGGQTNQQSSRQQHDAAGGESRGRRDAESQQSSTPYRNAMFSSLFEDSASHELRDLLAAV